MNYEPPTHLDLFSGIGGFSLAFESVGFKTIGFSEIDPYASAVLKKHWPDVPNYGDVRNVPALKCDVLTGGFPCQPFSVAGKRGGKADDRYLWPEMLAVIERCGPAWIVGENVPGIIGMELDGVLADLEGIGYAVQAFVVPACAVDAKHRRDRVWIVANASSNRARECGRGGIICDQFGHGAASECGRDELESRASVSGEAVANGNGNGRSGILRETGQGQDGAQQRTDAERESFGVGGSGAPREAVADGAGERLEVRKMGEETSSEDGADQGEAAGICGALSESACELRDGPGLAWDGRGQSADGYRWVAEPGVGRVAHGIPNRAHRLKCLGNAIVPQVAQVFAKAIYQSLTL